MALMLGACKLVPEPVENAVHVLTLGLCVLACVVGDVLLLCLSMLDWPLLLQARVLITVLMCLLEIKLARWVGSV